MKHRMRGSISTVYKPLLPMDRPLFLSETKSVQDNQLNGSSTKEWKKRKIQKKTLPDPPIPVVPDKLNATKSVASVTRTPDRRPLQHIPPGLQQRAIFDPTLRNGTFILPPHVPPPWARSTPVIAIDPRLPVAHAVQRIEPQRAQTCGHQSELREDSLAPKIISTPQPTEKLFVAFGRPFGFAVMDSPYLKRALEVQITVRTVIRA